MKKIFIIANWKSNKNVSESNHWLQEFSIFNFPSNSAGRQISNEKEVIICPPFTLLPTMKWYIETKKLPVKLGSQNISPFEAGAYTGEVNAEQIKELADYVIIGHSERRNNFGETDEMLMQKVKMALKAGLIPIYCIQDENTLVPEGVSLVAYEPLTAIGTGNPDTPENAERVANKVKQRSRDIKHILYGGSVTADNVRNFTSLPSIDGVLVGSVSLGPAKFTDLIKNA